jgi:hypothetical protein
MAVEDLAVYDAPQRLRMGIDVSSTVFPLVKRLGDARQESGSDRERAN